MKTFSFCIALATLTGLGVGWYIAPAQASPKSSAELYQKEWLIGTVRVTRILDETTDNTCYIAKSQDGVAISCLR